MGGIYIIQNLINHKVYVGRTKNFNRRFKQYEYDFTHRRINHINSYLLSSMIKYGFDNFSFEIWEICDLCNQKDREFYWMTAFNSTDRNLGYNLRLDTAGGMITNEKTSNEISERLKKEWSEGVRSSHSDKMKASWSMRDRSFQSTVMTKALTIYKYFVSDENKTLCVKYSDLVEMGLKNVISTFHETKSDDVKFKGYNIRRVLIE